MEKDTTVMETIEEAGKHPTLDEFYRRNPHSFTEEEWTLFLEREREARATFMAKEMGSKEDEK